MIWVIGTSVAIVEGGAVLFWQHLF